MTKPPSFGKDLEPTEEMIAQGRFGNGSYGTDHKAMEIVRAERRRLAIERKERVRQEYEASAVETLVDVATLQDNLVRLSVQRTKEVLDGKRDLDKMDLELAAKALKAAEQISNRILGLASRLDDKAVKQDGLSFLVEGQEVTTEEPNDE